MNTLESRRWQNPSARGYRGLTALNFCQRIFIHRNIITLEASSKYWTDQHFSSQFGNPMEFLEYNFRFMHEDCIRLYHFDMKIIKIGVCIKRWKQISNTYGILCYFHLKRNDKN